jgi:hypothetical protein
MEAIVEAGAGIGWRARVRHDVWQVELRRVVHDMMATPGTCAFPTASGFLKSELFLHVRCNGRN